LISHLSTEEIIEKVAELIKTLPADNIASILITRLQPSVLDMLIVR
jgi:hypothetical protein